MVWAVGGRGTVLRSLNGGGSFTLRPLPAAAAAATLNAVFFAGRDKGWVVGNDRAVWRTLDAGDTWLAVALPGSLPSNNLLFRLFEIPAS